MLTQLVLWALCASMCFGQDALNIGFTSSTFSNVNITDALASLKIWATEIVHKKGYTIPPQTAVFENVEDLVVAVKARKIDLVICRSNEFVEALYPLIEPHFICTKKGRAEEESLLLVHQQSGIEKLEDLAGKSILFPNGTGAALGRIWLETLLLEKGLASIDTFFRKADLTIRDSQAVLPVFFQKADACLVARSSFETISDLNPQLRSNLRVIARSPGFAATLVCIRKGYNPSLRADLLESLRTLHNEPKGQQIMMLFKTDQLLPCESAYLIKIGQLINRHDQLRKSAKGH
jgi:ABC-type phosphate/phosphonate transport system substrate-binding protein